MTGFDLSGVSDIRLGSNPVEVYLGGTKIWPLVSVLNFSFTGAVQSCELPAGRYKLQCWGAQGGSNAADADYGITSQAGGKGGYSEGILKLTSATTVYIFVGGQGGSSGNGGWNCGGGSSGSASNTSSGTTRISKMACGGGATDIALTTSTMTYSSRRNNRSSASLLSRFIVAGGGSGGAMCCTRTVTTERTVNGSDLTAKRGFIIQSSGKWTTSNNYRYDVIDVTSNTGQTFSITDGTYGKTYYTFLTALPPTTSGVLPSYATGYSTYVYEANGTGTVPSDAVYMWVGVSDYGTDCRPSSIAFTSVSESTVSQAGYVGGGINGGGYVSSTIDRRGKQDSAGFGGDFGLGANQTATSTPIAGAAGGAGWYGGGNNSSVSTANVVKQSGGGSGFVNIAENAQYRPTGYTGLELDSGTTYDGTQTFEAVNGGAETGHEGNGYVRITRL